MIVQIEYDNTQYKVDFNEPIDLSIPLGKVKCFNAPDLKMKPYTNGSFIGARKAGAPVNFFNVELNPHGNGTHTECLGHITKEQESINSSLKEYHFMTRLVSVELQTDNEGGQIITREEIIKQCKDSLPESLIIRTLPNLKSKLTMDYSNKNPPYLEKEAMLFLVEKKVKHLLIDLPSVDKEIDGGKLVAHHIFWGLDESSNKNIDRTQCTITELIYVDTKIKDGVYLLNLQVAPLELDASISRPVIYKLKAI